MIDKPITGVQLEQRTHPAGRKGAMLSLDEVADRAWKARMSPRLRAWVLKQIADAGLSPSRSGRRRLAQCILDAFRKKVPYAADPLMGEFMATPDQLLCLDEGGLCIIGGDCDEAAITLAAAMMTLGIPTMVIGSSHKDPVDVPTHVFMAFQDEMEDWVRMDGTTRFPVGQVAPHLREWWVEPGKEQKDRAQGDFVGMSGGEKGDGNLNAPPSKLDLLYPGIR
jgi:hypothetical protein